MGDEGWHPGVVGIVAARLVDKFSMPAVVVGFEDGMGRGSARSLAGFDVGEALRQCASHLVRCGGHAAAAGLTVRRHEFDAFRDAMVAEAGRYFSVPEAAAAAARIDVDAEVGLVAFAPAAVSELDKLGPFGNAHPPPLFLVKAARVTRARVVGKGHLQLGLNEAGCEMGAIAFSMGDRAPQVGAVIDVLVYAEMDTYRGTSRVQLRVRDFWTTCQG